MVATGLIVRSCPEFAGLGPPSLPSLLPACLPCLPACLLLLLTLSFFFCSSPSESWINGKELIVWQVVNAGLLKQRV